MCWRSFYVLYHEAHCMFDSAFPSAIRVPCIGAVVSFTMYLAFWISPPEGLAISRTTRTVFIFIFIVQRTALLAFCIFVQKISAFCVLQCIAGFLSFLLKQEKFWAYLVVQEKSPKAFALCIFHKAKSQQLPVVSDLRLSLSKSHGLFGRTKCQ